jgi:hypothetical protein
MDGSMHVLSLSESEPEICRFDSSVNVDENWSGAYSGQFYMSVYSFYKKCWILVDQIKDVAESKVVPNMRRVEQERLLVAVVADSHV